jgi:GTPase
MKIIFGPVNSKRLGNSLGIDIVPYKICTFDCIYCEIGKTTKKTIERESFFDPEILIPELDESLKKHRDLNFITFSGSGEPTLNKDIGKIIDLIKDRTDIPITVITNGSLLHIEQVREDISKADLIMPSLDAPSDEIFKLINQPHKNLEFEKIISGLEKLRDSFPGRIDLEIMFIKGLNDSNQTINSFKKVLSRLKFDSLFLNTVVRPPAYSNLCKPLSSEELDLLKKTFQSMGFPIDSADMQWPQKRNMFANLYEKDELFKHKKDCGFKNIF